MISKHLFKTHKLFVLLAIASVLLYAVFAYQLVRTNYALLVSLYSVLFILFYRLVQNVKLDFKFLAAISIIFRLIFLFAIPNLSQDFYRFIWDGRMILEGFNPYLYTVESFLINNELPVNQAQELYEGMGALNASHYTNYPPIKQLCFVIAGLFAGNSILGSAIVMRVLIIAADLGTLYFGKKLLERLNIPVNRIFWYILNPFIIIELTGNLHFEGIMIFFLVWSLYLLHKGKWQWAAVVFALSVSVKLIPLIFLPLFWQWFIKKRDSSTKLGITNDNVIARSERRGNLIETNRLLHFIRNDGYKRITRLASFYFIVGLVTILLFLPFYSPKFLTNYSETVALWFQNFEFNASLYYIAREIGYTFRGYNEIAIIGKYIPIVVISFVLLITFLRKNRTIPQLIAAMLLVLSFYFFTATTVHPWYIATLVILSIFTNYRFPLVWSFVIIFSYLAYINIDSADKSENLWIIGLEYAIVFGVFFWELFWMKTYKTVRK